MPDAAPKERTPLTFTFKNIGPIEKADLELGDLTIVAGRNNTGKTYLVYTLYGFLKAWADWPGPSLTPARYRGSEPSRRSVRYPIFERISQQVQESGQAELPADRDALNGERNEALNALTHSFSKGPLARVFSSPLEEFKDASIGVKLNQEFPLHPRPVNGIEPEDELSIRYDGANLSVIATQPKSKDVHPVALRHLLWHHYLRFLLPELPPDPFVLSAERFGISLFYRELDFRKSQLVDLLQKYGDSKGKDDDFPFLLLDERVSPSRTT